jgi:hypothetical protein
MTAKANRTPNCAFESGHGKKLRVPAQRER